MSRGLPAPNILDVVVCCGNVFAVACDWLDGWWCTVVELSMGSVRGKSFNGLRISWFAMSLLLMLLSDDLYDASSFRLLSLFKYLRAVLACELRWLFPLLSLKPVRFGSSWNKTNKNEWMENDLTCLHVHFFRPKWMLSVLDNTNGLKSRLADCYCIRNGHFVHFKNGTR